MDTVKIGGKERPVKFGFNTLAEFGRLTGMKLNDLQNLGETLTVGHVITLVWCGLKYGAKKEGEKFDFTQDDIGDWLDEDPNLVAEMMSYYGESQAPAGPAKKKRVQKKK